MRQESLWQEILEFFQFLYQYFRKRLNRAFRRFEHNKGILVEALYQKRGKYVRPFLHSGMIGLVFVGITLGPIIIQKLPGQENIEGLPGTVVLGQTPIQTETLLSEKPRAEVIAYTVIEDDTLSKIAEKFDVSLETLLWANGLNSKSKIKPGEQLKIPPVTGIVHKVRRGETIYSISKKYSVAAQNIVNWPFNSYSNDETFALAVGQTLIIPGGILPKAKTTTPSRYITRRTPDAGAVTATGQFVWPTSGKISQSPVWYHMAVDISNKSAPDILAADSGKVVVAGAPDRYGYGIRVVIDHGNGFQTLYAHLQSLYVSAGQRVSRGTAIGRMGSTGRSTGTHLHFEVRKNGSLQNPLNYLN